MKVKFLLVPASIIVALVVAIWHVWPTWFDASISNSIKTLTADIEKKEIEINRIKEREKNINKLTVTLQEDSTTRDLVFNYYPIVRKEEDVINKINHVALGSGVFLTKVNVEYGKIDEKNNSSKILAIPVKKEEVKAGSNNIEQAIANEKALKDLSKKFVTLSIGTYGDYDQIKGFLAGLNATGILNNIQSFEIKKEENKNVATGEGESATGKLTAEIKVSFGYADKKNKKSSDLIDDALFESGSFNLEELNEKKNLMTEDYPNSEVGEMGSINPFKP